MATDVIGSDELIVREDRAYVGVNLIKRRRPERYGYGEGRKTGRSTDSPVLGFHEHHRLQAGDERETPGLEVDVLRVQHLQTGSKELRLYRVGVALDEDRTQRHGEQSAIRVSEDVKLHLADTEEPELLIEGAVRGLH